MNSYVGRPPPDNPLPQLPVGGKNQYWQTFDSTERTWATIYVNDTDQPIWVAVYGDSYAAGGYGAYLYVDNPDGKFILVAYQYEYGNGPGYTSCAYGLVPPGRRYRINASGVIQANAWAELREAPEGIDIINTSTPGAGSVVIPAGVTRIEVTASAGGGGGSSLSRSASDDFWCGGGGGAGGGFVRQSYTVTPGETVNFNVGGSGAGGVYSGVFFGTAGGAGGVTDFTGTFGTVTLTGGTGGLTADNCGGAYGCGGPGGSPNGGSGQAGTGGAYGPGYPGANPTGRGSGGYGGVVPGNNGGNGATGYLRITGYKA